MFLVFTEWEGHRKSEGFVNYHDAMKRLESVIGNRVLNGYGIRGRDVTPDGMTLYMVDNMTQHTLDVGWVEVRSDA
jgi:hypothetical protein